MSIRVDNLDNLFGDNGSYRLPNTYPKLATGKWFNKTPVMTTAVSGWVVLEGDGNYCEYQDELYFLKKDILLSAKKKKYRYILIKDHFCNILKNKGNVFVQGTLVNASLDRLNGDDFNFTHSVISNFGKKLLYPLRQQHFDGKHHLIPIAPTKVFEKRAVIDTQTFSLIIARLEHVARVNDKGNPNEPKNDALTIFSRIPKKRTLVNDWRNEIVAKIKDLLSKLNDDDVILAKVSATGAFRDTDLAKKGCITYASNSIGEAAERDEFKQIEKLDLSGLEDIKAVQITGDHKETSFVPSNFKFYYDDTATPDGEAENFDVTILEKKVRIPFSNPYSTRTIYHSGRTLYATDFKVPSDFYPQKILIKNENPLVFKTAKKNPKITSVRTEEEFRSVYLYYCENFNFMGTGCDNLGKPELNRIRNEAYIVADDAPSKHPAFFSGFCAWDLSGMGRNAGWYPFGQALKDAKENFTFGGLVGQFSRLISTAQKDNFDHYYPYLVKRQFQKLKRIRGLKPVVQRLIQNADYFEPQEESSTYSKSNIDTLDVFDYLPKRFVENTKELDFQIGEKLLFYTGNTIAYSFFQPVHKDYAYGAYELRQLVPSFKNTLSDYWAGYGWVWNYDLGNFNSVKKNGLKKAYDGFKEYHFPTSVKHFFTSEVQPYLNFEKTHVMRNTNAFFEIEDVPLPTIKKGDYFGTDLEYFGASRNPSDSIYSRLDTAFFSETVAINSDLEHNEIVVYSDVNTKKLVIGRVEKIPLTVTLPEGQYFAQPSQSESSQNTLKYNAYRLTNASTRAIGFSDFTSLIQELKDNAHLYYTDGFSFSINDVKEPFLFDLTGTDFYAYLDKSKNLHLIFKKDDYITDANQLVYSIDVEDTKEHFLPVQVVNQKCVLSFYGMKINLPVKVFEKKALITILVDTAKGTDSIMDSASVQVKHSLGTSYFRLDIPKRLPRKSEALYDPFQVEALQSSIKRSYEDYRLQKEAQDLQFQAIDNQFDDQKWALAQSRKENLVNSILTGIGQVTSFATGLYSSGITSRLMNNTGEFLWNNFINQNSSPFIVDPSYPLPAFPSKFYTAPFLKSQIPNVAAHWKNIPHVRNPNYDPPMYAHLGQHSSALFSVGDYRVRGFANQRAMLGSALGQGVSQIGSTVASYIFNTQKFDRQSEQLARDIQLNTQQKMLDSYQLDLSFDRLRSGAALEIRRMFSFQNFTSSSSYERNEQLDKQELANLAYPVYLELWVPAPEQLSYLNSFHNKYGVDCRITHQTLYIRDGMPLGIFKFEEPTIINLNDFIDNALIKAKFEQGVKIEHGDEAEVTPDMIPVDPRILKLQNQLQLLQTEEGVLKQKIQQKEEQVEQYWMQLKDVSQKKDDLEHDLEETKVKVSTLTTDLEARKADVEAKDRLWRVSQDKVIALNKEITNQGKRYGDLAKSYRDVESDRDQQKQLANLYKDEKTKLTETNKALTTAKENLEKQVGQEQAKFSSLEIEKKNIEEELKGEQAKVSAFEKAKQDWESEKLILELKVKALEVEKGLLEIKEQEYKDENIQLHKELLKLEQSSFKTELEETKETLGAVREIETSLKNQIKELRDSRAALFQSINSLFYDAKYGYGLEPLLVLYYSGFSRLLKFDRNYKIYVQDRPAHLYVNNSAFGYSCGAFRCDGYVKTWFIDNKTKRLEHQPSGSWRSAGSWLESELVGKEFMGRNQLVGTTMDSSRADYELVYPGLGGTDSVNEHSLLAESFYGDKSRKLFQRGSISEGNLKDRYINIRTYGDYLKLLGLVFDPYTKSAKGVYD